MFFLLLCNTNIDFEIGRLTWRLFTTAETLLITSRVKPIHKHKFAKAALDENSETFVMHITTLEVIEMTIHLSKVDQVLSEAAQLAAL